MNGESEFTALGQLSGQPHQGQQQQQPPPGVDPEKRKLIQQQLALLIHAHKCQRRENQANGELRPCMLPHCLTMRNVIKHMANCQAGKSCSVPHCASSRQLISHWKNCFSTNCSICLPLRTAEKQNQSNNTVVTSQHVPSTHQGPTLVEWKRANESLGIPYLANSLQTRHPSPQRAVELRPPELEEMNPLPGQQPRQLLASSFQILYSRVQPGTQPRQPQQGPITDAGMAQATVAPIQGFKEWQESVTPELRNHIVKKVVTGIFPTNDPTVVGDKRMHNLVAYAQKVEREIYEVANSRPEYYHLVAEKLYKIQKDIEERRQQRRQRGLGPSVHAPEGEHELTLGQVLLQLGVSPASSPPNTTATRLAPYDGRPSGPLALVHGGLPTHPLSAHPQPAPPGIRPRDPVTSLQSTEGPSAPEPAQSGPSSAEIVDSTTQVSKGALHRESGPSSTDIPPRFQCVICMNEEVEVVHLPCRHMVTCEGCNNRLKRVSPGCPSCRTPIKKRLLVFRP